MKHSLERSHKSRAVLKKEIFNVLSLMVTMMAVENPVTIGKVTGMYPCVIVITSNGFEDFSHWISS